MVGPSWFSVIARVQHKRPPTNGCEWCDAYVTSVQIAPRNNDLRLSSNEANQIMASFGYSNLVRDSEGWLWWGKEGDIISGYYDVDALNIDTGMKPK